MTKVFEQGKLRIHRAGTVTAEQVEAKQEANLAAAARP